jgi:hypothetical protein
MTDYVQRAAFLGTVKVGDRVRYLSDEKPFMTVTGRMDDTFPGFNDIGPLTIVQLIGMYDDGSPAILQGKPSNPVIVQVLVDADVDGAP